MTVGNVDVALLIKNTKSNPDEATQDDEQKLSTEADGTQVTVPAVVAPVISDKIMPGVTLPKELLIKNVGMSKAYVRLRVVVPAAIDDLITINGAESSGFTRETEAAAGEVHHVFTYEQILPPFLASTTGTPITGITMDSGLDSEQLTAFYESEQQIRYVVEAIQVTGFQSAAEAFEAFEDQTATN